MSMTKRIKYPLITFVVAFVVLGFVYATVGMYPFGDRQVMIIDSWHQYFPFFRELSLRLRSGESILYTYNSGLGTNFIALIAYYAMSPLNLLSILVPVDYLREFFYIAIILKISIGGMFFSIYIQNVYKKYDLSATVFGLMYAFSGFFINYYWNTMWLDAVAMLPLIILGVHKVIDENKYTLYVLSLAIAIISNFYIGYFICEFIAIYYFVLYFTKRDNVSVKDFFKSIGKMALGSLGALMIASVVIIPVYYAMQNVYGLSSYNPKEVKSYYTMFEIINNMFINAKPTIVDGMPNIYSTVLALMLTVIYFFSSVKVKDKVINAIMIAFLLLSFNINYLNFAWHGFHFPNQVPYRFSFVFSFLIITLAYEGYVHLNSVKNKDIVKIFVSLVIFALFLEYNKIENFDFSTYYLTIFAFVLYGQILIVYNDGRLKKGLFLIIIMLLVLSEGMVLTTNAFFEGGSSGRNDYYPNLAEIEHCFETIANKDDSFYRMEIVPRFSTNDSIHYRYRGVAQFSSMANANVSQFTRNIGMPSDAGSNTIGYGATTPAVNSMINLKYVISKKNHVPVDNAQYKLVLEDGDVTALENKYYLPIAYMVDADLENERLSSHKPLYNQQRFYKMSTGIEKDFYTSFEPVEESYNNIKVTNKNAGRYNYKNINKNAKGDGKITFEIQEEGQYYLYFLNQNKKLKVRKNGNMTSYKARRGVIADLGKCIVGDEISVEFDVDAQASGYFELDLVKFNEKVFGEYIDELRKQTMKVDEFKDTYIKGSIDVKNAGFLYTSIPYEKGFKVFVDGKVIRTRAFDDAFITFPLGTGHHDIEFYYETKGLRLGINITIIALIALIIVSIVRFVIRKRKERDYDDQEVEDESYDDEEVEGEYSDEQYGYEINSEDMNEAGHYEPYEEDKKIAYLEEVDIDNTTEER